jgi:hypothetical protein
VNGTAATAATLSRLGMALTKAGVSLATGTATASAALSVSEVQPIEQAKVSMSA